MKVLDRIPERGGERAFKRRIAELDEIKGAFQSLGSRSVRTQRIFSDSEYDVQINPTTSPGVHRVHRVDVEFVPTHLSFGGAFCLGLQVKARNLTGGTIDRWAIETERRPTRDGKQVWSVYYSTFGYAEDAVRLKFYLSALGSGTIQATVVT